MNILFILEDALRPDHLGCYGYKKNTSPHIDRIAAEGVVFENTYATASHTLPPIVSMIMGQTTAKHGVVSPERFSKWINSRFWEKRDTPLKLMHKSGYKIDGELVMRWKPLGFTRDTPTQDMESYFERNRNADWFFMAEPYPTHLPYNPPEEYFHQFLDREYTASERTREVLSVVRSKLIVHPSGLISKLEAGEKEPLPDTESDEQHKRSAGTADLQVEDGLPIRALYDGEIKVFDDMVGKWIQKLEELDILDKTLVIIVSDHGEELMERGCVGHSSCNLKGTLYDESIHVPLIFRLPGVLPAGKRVQNQISQIDIMPTILDILGLSIPDYMEGRSALPLILGKEGAFREEIYAETTPAGWQALADDHRIIRCIRTSKSKLIQTVDENTAIERFELYDLLSDPGERENIYSAGHPEFRRLNRMLADYIALSRKAVF
jgi:arylsulfatase A-like enzyme